MNMHHAGQLPKARKDKLIIKELVDETLVYDLETDEAHCLNLTAAHVWKQCDGEKTFDQLREQLAKETGLLVPEEVIWLALDKLEKFRLLQGGLEKPFQLPGLTRRELVRRAGLAALALPAIVSLTTSPAHAQASLLPPGRCCGNPNDCASNSCVQIPSCVPPPPAAPATKGCA